MNLSNFTKEELSIIESFLASSNKVSNIYDNLYKLEISGKKDSSEYKQLIDTLKEAIKEENELYLNADLTTKQKFNIVNLLVSSPSTLEINNITCIINGQYSDKIVRRILNILINQIIISMEFTKTTIPEELFELLNNLGMPIDNKKAYKELNNYSKIQIASNSDMMIMFLAILQETLNTRKYSKYKNEMIEAMYITSFINKDIENSLIENNFTIPEQIYINSKMVNDLLKIDTEMYNITSAILAEGRLRTHIIKLLEIKDEEYNNTKTSVSSSIIQCYIRALLTFMNDDDIYRLNYEFHELIDSPEYLKEHPKDRISEEAIMNCFKSIKYDRQKKRTISFRPNK